MGSTDVVALVISLVALLITSIQAIQQYAATAYGYRNCTRRTIGGWATQTKRRFIWSEIRYEITYVAPRLSVIPRQTGYFLESEPTPDELPPDFGLGAAPFQMSFAMQQQNEPNAEQEKRPKVGVASGSSSKATYLVSAMKKYSLLPMNTADLPPFPRPGQFFDTNDSPWFLDSRGTVPEGKCTWISLLQDTSFSEMRVNVGQRQGSLDFLPDGVSKPLALMDRTSFLTLMSLYRVRWKSESDLTGTGELCEISLRNIQNFGDVYFYRRLLPDGIHLSHSLARYHVPTIRARDAMFNRFDLGFAALLTDSPSSLAKSLKTIGVDFFTKSNALDPGKFLGTGDVIACWATPSMPKQILEQSGTFLSVFSSHSSYCLFEQPHVAHVLSPECDPGIDPENVEMTQLRDWIQAYLTLASDTDEVDESLIREQLNWAAERLEDDPIPWSRAKACLPLIRQLDKHLYFLLRALHRTTSNQIKLEFARLQIDFVYRESRDIFTASGSVVPLHVAKSYAELKGKLPLELLQVKDDSKLPEMLIANRLLRGMLWVIHNGNGPTSEERMGECTLGSKWLRDASTVYIA